VSTKEGVGGGRVSHFVSECKWLCRRGQDETRRRRQRERERKEGNKKVIEA
jgi:hypothetical protein